ncbi:MAG: tyrosine-type recombinase/integrase [Firmicutes bacterium]|nr:tyrosine-type recombinase/integrase [Bacillota bacterium]
MKQLRIKYEATLKQLFNNFLTSRQALGVTEKTIKTYKAHFQAMSHYLDTDELITEFQEEAIEEMIVSMRRKELSANSIKSYLITLRAFFRWCKEKGICDITVKPYKGKDIIKEPYTDKEVEALLKKPNLRNCSFTEYRNWVMVCLLLNCGCRAATLRSITVQDVNLDHEYILFRHTKSQRIQTIPLCKQMINILREYLLIRKGEGSDPLFCSQYGKKLNEAGLRKAIATYNQSRGIKKTSTHLYRHTFSKIFLLDCGGNAFTLQRILGHSTLDMTKHYCNIYDADLINNFDELSPLAIYSKREKSITKADIQKRR